jgi:hypothetical protein
MGRSFHVTNHTFGDFWRTTKLTKNTKKKGFFVVFGVFVVD